MVTYRGGSIREEASMDLGLAGRVALVTGGARDVGRAIALTLGREGMTVAVNYLHSKAEAEETVEAIRAAGGRARAWPADIADHRAVTDLVEGVVREHGRLDVLVNNAGYLEQKLFLDTTPAEWTRQVDVCFYGVLNCCHAAARLGMAGGGRIISIVGDSARVGQPRLSISAGARGGVLSLTKTLARELGRRAITVNALALGWIETSHVDPAWLAANRDKILAAYPIRRLGQPADVAPLVAFLASDLAGWITGQTISVSGGYATVG
jgi:NAD(P)-dependent dehydrogenase (short-subunit alcohol dehydrogenase family)